MALASKYGEDTETWVDKDVIVYPDQTLFQGRMVDCIRMRVPAAAATEEDAIPF